MQRRQATDGLPFDPDLGNSPSGANRPEPWHARFSVPPGPARFAAVSAGGALGGAARYGVEDALQAPVGAFPWATFTVNIAGAFLLALLLVLILEVWPPSRYLRPFAAIGLLGSFTTFSTWMLETRDLAADGDLTTGALYLLGSLAAGVAATSLGLVIGRAAANSHPGADPFNAPTRMR